MIKAENLTINGKAFIKQYSDSNLYIKRVGTDAVYSEAVDLVGHKGTYEETDKQIEEVNND